MNIATFRRYLQPSPTLRWHPWAPLVAGLLFVIFVFTAAAYWGYGVGKRLATWNASTHAFFVAVRIEDEEKGNIRSLLRDANHLDRAVLEWDRLRKSPPGSLEKWWRGVENRFFTGTRNMDWLHEPPRQKLYAEVRLAHFSAGAPRWQATRRFCESRTHGYATVADIHAQYERLASLYTELLGRPVSARELAPMIEHDCTP